MSSNKAIPSVQQFRRGSLTGFFRRVHSYLGVMRGILSVASTSCKGAPASAWFIARAIVGAWVDRPHGKGRKSSQPRHDVAGSSADGMDVHATGRAIDPRPRAG